KKRGRPGADGPSLGRKRPRRACDPEGSRSEPMAQRGKLQAPPSAFNAAMRQTEFGAAVPLGNGARTRIGPLPTGVVFLLCFHALKRRMPALDKKRAVQVRTAQV